MHPAIQDDCNLVESLVALAKQFLAEEGIAIGGMQYRADLQALEHDSHEFARVLMFVKHLYPNEDFPDGMSEQDLNPGYLARYPFLAAVGVISTAGQFREVADRIGVRPSPAQCHNYALTYWRIRWLAEALSMSEVYKDAFRNRQKKIAGNPRQDALQRLIIAILTDHRDYTWREVLTDLKQRQGDDIIETVTDDEIEWTADSGTAKNTKTSALADRVSRAKQYLKSR